MHSGHYALYLSSSKWILKFYYICPFPPLCLMTSWQKMTSNFSKQFLCIPDNISTESAKPRCEFRHVAFRNECNMIRMSHTMTPVWVRTVLILRGIRSLRYSMPTSRSDCVSLNSVCYDNHEVQIRQRMQMVNKRRVNTSPDDCQCGNMLHVLLSLLIIRRDLSEVAMQNGSYSKFTMAG